MHLDAQAVADNVRRGPKQKRKRRGKVDEQKLKRDWKNKFLLNDRRGIMETKGGTFMVYAATLQSVEPRLATQSIINDFCRYLEKNVGRVFGSDVSLSQAWRKFVTFPCGGVMCIADMDAAHHLNGLVSTADVEDAKAYCEKFEWHEEDADGDHVEEDGDHGANETIDDTIDDGRTGSQRQSRSRFCRVHALRRVHALEATGTSEG